MHRACQAQLAAGESAPFRILTVPCGIPRDVHDFIERLAAESPELLRLVEYDGMDLDPAVVDAANVFLAAGAINDPHIIEGNALDASCYSVRSYDFIASTGLGEFLGDEELSTFYGNVFAALAPGGTFFTSAAAFDKTSDALLRTFELNSHYRTRADLARLLAPQSWAKVEFERHSTGLQTFVRAIKG